MSGPPLHHGRRMARLLCGKGAEHASGILTASLGKLRRLFCMEQGWIVYVASNLLEEQFAEYLVRNGIVEPASRASAVEEAQRSKRVFTEVLVERGAPTAERLRRAMEGLVVELLTSSLEWPDGQAEFAAGTPRLDGEITVRLQPLQLVLRHAKRYPAAADALRVRIGPPDLKPLLGADAKKLVHGLAFDETGRFLLGTCDGTADLASLAARAPESEEITLRTLYGFLLAGILEPPDARKRADDLRRQKEPPVTREECLARFHIAAANEHYTVLGIERDAPRPQIRDAYYSLARRFHPDRFRAGQLQDLLPQIEQYFSKVTEAYNTIYDPERRAEYDQQLALPKEAEPTRQSETAYLARQNYLRGKALAQQKKLNEAAGFLENAVRLDDNQADFHLELGLVLGRNPRRREDAERHLLRAAELSPATVDAYFALGQLYQRSARRPDAIRLYREALRWDPDHRAAAAALAELGAAAETR